MNELKLYEIHDSLNSVSPYKSHFDLDWNISKESPFSLAALSIGDEIEWQLDTTLEAENARLLK